MGVFYGGGDRRPLLPAAFLMILLAVLLLALAISWLDEYEPVLPGRGEGDEDESVERVAPPEDEGPDWEEEEESEPGFGPDPGDPAFSPFRGDLDSDEECWYGFEGTGPFHVPLFEIIGEGHWLYLRTEARELYYVDDDRRDGWYADPGLESQAYRGETIDPGLKPWSLEREATIGPLRELRGYIPVKFYPTRLSFPGEDVISFPDRYSFFSFSHYDERYQFTYRSARVDPKLSKDSPRSPGGSFGAEYADRYGPPDDGRLEELLGRIFDDDPRKQDPYPAVTAIADYLSANYRLESPYALTTDHYDAVSGFLFQEGAGGVMDFNTALVLLARQAGLPARLAVGFRVDPDKTYQVVYNSQYYAYAEIYLEEIGWVPFDAVPGYRFYTPPETSETAITTLREDILKGETLRVSGEVSSPGGEVLEGPPVLLYIKGDPTEDRLSSGRAELTSGLFSGSFTVGADVAAGPAWVVAKTLACEHYGSSGDLRPLNVYAETLLDLDLPGVVPHRADLRLQGQLREAYGNLPLPGELVTLQLEEEKGGRRLFGGAVSTGNEGRFERNLEADFFEIDPSFLSFRLFETRPVMVRAFYWGGAYHHPAMVESRVNVRLFYPRRAIFTFSTLLLGAALVLGLLLARRRAPAHGAAGAVMAPADDHLAGAQGEPGVEETVGPAYPLEVVFPGIAGDLPPVWGIGEKVIAQVRRPGDGGETGPAMALEVDFGDGTRVETEPSSGRAEHRYKEKGFFTVTAADTPGGAVLGAARVRIVDYHEEITRLGRDLFRLVRASDTVPAEEMTPRELMEAGLDALPAEMVPARADRRRLTLLFEYATYSLKTLGRDDYEIFYRLLAPIMKGLEGST